MAPPVLNGVQFLVTMNPWLFLVIPLSAAFIGWITIRIAIFFLFHPRQLRTILGLKLQGIFPRRREEFTRKLAITVKERFISFDAINAQISNTENLKKILPLIEDHIDDFLRNRLGKEMPMISMFIGDKTIGKLKTAFLTEIELLFPQVMQAYATNLEKEMDIDKLIHEKAGAIRVEELEKIVYAGMKRELKMARISGALIGFLIGLVQLLLLWLLR